VTATETRPLPTTFKPKRLENKPIPGKQRAVAWIQLDANGSEWVYEDTNVPSKLGYFSSSQMKLTDWVDHARDFEDVCEKFYVNYRFRESPFSPCGIHQVKDNGKTIHVYWAFPWSQEEHSTKSSSSKTSHARSSAGRDSRHEPERRESHSTRASGTPRERRRKDSDSPFGFTETLGEDHPSHPNNRRSDNSGDKGKGKSRR